MVIFDANLGPYRYSSMADKLTEMRLLGVEGASERVLAATLKRHGLLEPAWWCYMPRGALA